MHLDTNATSFANYHDLSCVRLIEPSAGSSTSDESDPNAPPWPNTIRPRHNPPESWTKPMKRSRPGLQSNTQISQFLVWGSNGSVYAHKLHLQGRHRHAEGLIETWILVLPNTSVMHSHNQCLVRESRDAEYWMHIWLPIIHRIVAIVHTFLVTICQKLNYWTSSSPDNHLLYLNTYTCFPRVGFFFSPVLRNHSSTTRE